MKSAMKSTMKSALLLRLEEEILKSAPGKSAALAFSAGVDSTILLFVLRRMGFDILAVTFDTKLTSKMVSLSNAESIALEYGATHIRLPIDVLSVPEIVNNDKLRCYYCKSAMFSALRKSASERGYSVCFDGTNADDLKEYRPGLRAKDENGIISPIANAGLTKEDIRAIGRELGLEIASAPSSPCLLTRFPYGTHVTQKMLEAVEAGEGILTEAGFLSRRLRIYGDSARIEIPDPENRTGVPIEELEELLKSIGVKHISIDPTGLHSGRMDEEN